MAGQPEDQRNAATIYTSLSSYVMTASLGVIAAQAAVATFVLDKRDHLTCFYICMVAGILASVVSVVLGGKGIAAIASGGFGGAWSIKPNGDPFNRQAIFCLLGVVLLLVSVFTGQTKPENPSAEQVQRLSATIAQQQSQIEQLKGKYAALADQLKSLSSNASHTAPPTAGKRR
jgi:uncharacterized coiled-coil protein SlyX